MTNVWPTRVRGIRGTGQALLLLLASTAALSGCSSTADDSASEMGGKGKVKVTPGKGGGSSTTGGDVTPTTTPSTSTSTVVYDTSVGNGVDGAGFADLPLRGGASRYFVSSAVGSDANSCAAAKAPTAPKATIKGAASCIVQGAGDQVLVAEGTSYSAVFPNMTGKDGFSPVYPTVFETYDPADPLNEAKYGRATSGRPLITAAGLQPVLAGAGTSPKYLAIRGFDFSPTNSSGNSFSMVNNTTGSADYILIENNIFRYMFVVADMAAPNTAGRMVGWVIRGNSIYGGWASSGHAQGLYMSGTNYTLEDNVIWHGGWKVGASRDDDISAGGLVGDAVFRHNVYIQENSSGTVRRNLSIDGAADGGQYRGDVLFTENIGIDNPIQVGLGGGDQYSTYRPDGVSLEASYNVFLGDADITSSDPRGWGVTSANGKPGSSFHHNVIARSRNPNNASRSFDTVLGYDVPSYMDWSDNVVYQWVSSGKTVLEETKGFTAGIFTSYNRNKWDDASSGTNVNISSVTFPNPYTMDQLYQALGFTGATSAARKQAFIDYMIAHPEDHGRQRSMLSLALQGYGIAH